jgi:UDPglucose--hexose-1-phosphate uridylyltransferase
VIAPGRARRPGAARGRVEPPTSDELDSCPFCEGREDRTPPETLALPAREPPDSPGWRVRVVPNLYPAFERQEVVIHTPRHARSFAELEDEEVEAVAKAWRLRARAAGDAGFGYVHALINEGREAGASLAHSHSQLVWLRDPPPAVVEERDAATAIFELLTSIRRPRTAPDLEVELDYDVLAFCPPASRAPYEVLISNAYIRDEAGFEAEAFPRGLLVLRNVVRRLRAIEGAVPWNAWVHVASDWHIELVPRLTVFAGIELGAGIWVNTLAPEEAAARLRAATP